MFASDGDARADARPHARCSTNLEQHAQQRRRQTGRTCTAAPSSWRPRPGRARRSSWSAKTRAVRDRYGRNPLGQNLLLARRLVESGVGFVTVNGWTGPAPGQSGGGPPSSSWDMHGGEMGMGNAFGNGSYGMGWCLPVLDQALSALLDDLNDRGLLDSTLVVVIGEFGRTPRINQNKRHPRPAALAALLLRDPGRRRHPRRHGLRRIRQDRGLREGQAGPPAGSQRDDLPRPRRAVRIEGDQGWPLEAAQHRHAAVGTVRLNSLVRGSKDLVV